MKEQNKNTILLRRVSKNEIHIEISNDLSNNSYILDTSALTKAFENANLKLSEIIQPKTKGGYYSDFTDNFKNVSIPEWLYDLYKSLGEESQKGIDVKHIVERWVNELGETNSPSNEQID